MTLYKRRPGGVVKAKLETVCCGTLDYFDRKSSLPEAVSEDPQVQYHGMTVSTNDDATAWPRQADQADRKLYIPPNHYLPVTTKFEVLGH
jgi:hypothetical protein